MNWWISRSFAMLLIVCFVSVGCRTVEGPIALPALDESREPAPSLALSELVQAPAGEEASWEALRGKVVVVEFWATWCGPCVAAIPHLNELAEAFADEPVVFLAISNEQREPVERFLQRREMKAWVALDDSNTTFDAYGVRGIPRTVLVDQHGRIAAVMHPAQLNETIIRNLLEGRDPGLTGQRAASATAGVTAGEDPAGADEGTEALVRVVIRPSEGSGVTAHGQGRYSADGVSLGTVIATAYGISETRIEGLEHLGDERYTIVINTPGRDDRLMRSLLRSALEAAFSFEARREPSTRTVYEVRVPADGEHKLEPTAMEGGSSFGTQADRIQGANVQFPVMIWGLEHLLSKPVFDETGLTGRYDITLRFDSQVRKWEGKERGEHLKDALREQLGLELVEAEREVEVLVIVPDKRVASP